MIPTKGEVFLDPVTFAETFLKIQDKHKRLVSLRYNKAQRHFLRNRTGHDLILKARQIGFSTLIQAELFRAVATQSATTLTLSHLDATTQSFRRMVDRFYENLPEQFRPLRKYANSTLTSYPDFDSEAIIGTAGSSQGGRGISASHAHFSEFAFYKDPEAILAGAMQSGNPNVVIESTPNGVSNVFHQLCTDALHNPDASAWRLHFYAWWWDESYKLPLESGESISYTDEENALVRKHGLTPEKIKWRRRKLRELPLMFLQEYPEDPVTCFLTSGRGVFNILPTMLRDDPPTPQADHVYVCGVDWGQQADYSAISIFDVTDYKEVYLTRIRHRSWASIRDDIVTLCKQWHVVKVEAEKNAMGSSQIEELFYSLSDNGLETVVEPFTMTNKKKDRLVKLLQRGINEDDLLLLDIDYATHELRSFETKQTPSGLWTYSHPSGGHDDTVIARMLANYAATRMAV